MCGRYLITGLTSDASPRVDISSTCKEGQKIGVSVPLLTCSPSAWPSRLLYRRGRKFRRDLWITLYIWRSNSVLQVIYSSVTHYTSAQEAVYTRGYFHRQIYGKPTWRKLNLQEPICKYICQYWVNLLRNVSRRNHAWRTRTVSAATCCIQLCCSEEHWARLTHTVTVRIFSNRFIMDHHRDIVGVESAIAFPVPPCLTQIRKYLISCSDLLYRISYRWKQKCMKTGQNLIHALK
jgi:hypothetical protein